MCRTTHTKGEKKTVLYAKFSRGKARKTHNIKGINDKFRKRILLHIRIAFSAYNEFDIDFLDKPNIPIEKNLMKNILW